MVGITSCLCKLKWCFTFFCHPPIVLCNYKHKYVFFSQVKTRICLSIQKTFKSTHGTYKIHIFLYSFSWNDILRDGLILPLCGAPSVNSPLSRAWTYALFCISMATVPAMSPKLLVHHQPAGQQKKRRKKRCIGKLHNQDKEYNGGWSFTINTYCIC